MHTDEQRAEERVAVASARLAEVLNLDPTTNLRAPPQATGLLQMVDSDRDLVGLIRQALEARPEMAALNAEVARRQPPPRQEQARPFLPTLSVGYSSGTFGGSTNRTDLGASPTSFGKFGSRADFDVVAFWTVQNLGVGNLARQNERRAQREVAALEEVRVVNVIRREVATAYARTLRRPHPPGDRSPAPANGGSRLPRGFDAHPWRRRPAYRGARTAWIAW